MSGVLLIRADAGAAIGTGHVMRCLALAQAWNDRGGSTRFVSADLPGRLATRLGAEAITQVALGAAAGTTADADETLEAAAQAGTDWIVLDGYHFDESYLRRVADGGARILVIDDDARRSHYPVDLLLNQNLSALSTCYPAGHRPRLLLGPRYALLRREFTGGRRAEPPSGELRRLLVLAGGSDPHGLAERTLAAVAGLGLTVRVVLGPANLRPDPTPAKGVEVLRDVRDMPSLFAWADFAVSSAGSTVWELALFGLPMILTAAVPVEAPVAEAMASQGAAAYLGPASLVTVPAIAGAVSGLLGEPDRARRMSTAAAALVDGRGAARVAEAMAGPGHPAEPGG